MVELFKFNVFFSKSKPIGEKKRKENEKFEFHPVNIPTEKITKNLFTWVPVHPCVVVVTKKPPMCQIICLSFY